MTNAAIYFAEGKYLDAGLSLISAAPGISEIVVMTKLGKGGAKTLKTAHGASGLGRQVAKHVDDVAPCYKRVANGLAGCFAEGTQVVVGMEYDEDGVFVQYVTARAS